MKVVAVATPDVFVVAVVVLVPLANFPPAPLAGAVNVTVTPLTGLLEASTTVAARFVVYAAPMVALCVAPAEDVIEFTGPGLFVKEKLAGPMDPAIAVTV